jgi:hypothetical protein
MLPLFNAVLYLPLLNYQSSQILSLSVALQPFGPSPLFQFFNPTHSRQDSLDGGSVLRKASTYTQNKRTQASMPEVGFEPTIPVFERAKTVHALNCASIVIGLHRFTLMTLWYYYYYEYLYHQ